MIYNQKFVQTFDCSILTRKVHCRQ